MNGASVWGKTIKGSRDGREAESKEGTNEGKTRGKREQSKAGRQEVNKDERARK